MRIISSRYDIIFRDKKSMHDDIYGMWPNNNKRSVIIAN